MVNRSILNIRLRALLKRRVRARAPELIVILVISTVGLALSGVFFIGSSSVLGSLQASWERTNLQAGSFTGPQQGVDTESGTIKSPGIEKIPSIDLDALDNSTLRVFPPRRNINKHEVIEGKDIVSNKDILLDAQYAKSHTIKIGDSISVGGTEYTVTGFVVLPEYIAVKNSQIVLQPNADSFGVALVSQEKFDEIADHPTVSYAYDNSVSEEDIIKKFDPIDIRNTENDSRVQQAIGDSSAPRDLALIIFIIFLVIISGLLGVYHYQTRSTESRNYLAFEQLGLSDKLKHHYIAETRIVLLISTILSGLIVGLALRPVMEINGQLYNYPELQINVPLFFAVIIGGGIVYMGIDSLIYYRIIKGISSSRTKTDNKAPRIIGLSLPALQWVPRFGYRVRILRLFRRPGEVVAQVTLLLVVCIFVSFSFTLKYSVDEWRESLSTNTPYAYMYNIPNEFKNSITVNHTDEKAKIATLYNGDGISQTVYIVPDNSKYFGSINGGTSVTKAYAEKFNLKVGDSFTLSSIDNKKQYNFHITAENDNSTSAFIYVTESQADKMLKDIVTGDVVFSEEQNSSLEGKVPTVTREQIVSAGGNIVRIIGIQVTLLVSIAVLLMCMMLFAICRFTMGNNKQFISIMKKNGYSSGIIVSSLFGFIMSIAVFSALVSEWISEAVVRVFLDKIMFRFVNYVPVSSNNLIKMIIIGGMVCILSVLIRVVVIKINKEK